MKHIYTDVHKRTHTHNFSRLFENNPIRKIPTSFYFQKIIQIRDRRAHQFPGTPRPRFPTDQTEGGGEESDGRQEKGNPKMSGIP